MAVSGLDYVPHQGLDQFTSVPDMQFLIKAALLDPDQADVSVQFNG